MVVHLSRDERLSARVLRDAGWEYGRVATHLGFTERQVWYACHQPGATPIRHSGRQPALSQEQVNELITLVTSSRSGRRMGYARLAAALDFGPGCGMHAIRNALRREGFSRRLAMRKPPITEQNRVKRLAFAHAHAHWTVEDWKQVLWSDETWITGGRHTRTWVTRRVGEEWDSTCVVDRIQRKP
jgi:hypothetical protein